MFGHLILPIILCLWLSLWVSPHCVSGLCYSSCFFADFSPFSFLFLALSFFICFSFLKSDISILIHVSVFVYFDTFSFHVIKCNVYKKLSMLSFVFLTALSRLGSRGAGSYPSYIWAKAGSTLGWAHCQLTQLIAGPYVSNCGFSTLLKGTSTLLWRCSESSPYQNTLHENPLHLSLVLNRLR